MTADASAAVETTDAAYGSARMTTSDARQNIDPMSATEQGPKTKAEVTNGAAREDPADARVDPLDAEATKALDVRVVGVAYDGSPESKQALANAQRFAEARHATLRLITAVPPLEWWVSRNFAPEELREWRRAEFRRRLDEAAQSLPGGLPHETVLHHGHPSDVIVREADNGIDVLFLGSNSYGRWAGSPRDDTATEVMRQAPCPVIVVSPGTGLSHVIHTVATQSSPDVLPPRAAPAKSPTARGESRRPVPRPVTRGGERQLRPR
jgi:nucleotide-binding universal stress UspA family protein